MTPTEPGPGAHAAGSARALVDDVTVVVLGDAPAREEGVARLRLLLDVLAERVLQIGREGEATVASPEGPSPPRPGGMGFGRAVHELLEEIAIEPSSLSQQLAVLRRTSLVVSHRGGGEVVYSISVPEVRDLLLAARKILSGLLAAQAELSSELALDEEALPR